MVGLHNINKDYLVCIYLHHSKCFSDSPTPLSSHPTYMEKTGKFQISFTPALTHTHTSSVISSSFYLILRNCFGKSMVTGKLLINYENNRELAETTEIDLG